MASVSIFQIFLICPILGFTHGFIMPEPTQNASVIAMYMEFKTEIAQLNNQLSTLKIDFANIKIDNDNLKSTFNNLTTKYANVRSELTNITNDNVKIQQSVNNLKTEISKIETGQRTLTTNFVDVKQEFNSLGSKYSDLITKYENLTNQGQGHVPAGSHGNNPVVKAPRVGFSVSAPDGVFTYMRNGPLNFTSANYNDQEAFNFTSGMFECAVPGVYYFSATLVRVPGGYPESYCYLMINGHALAYLGGYGYNASLGHPSGTATMVYHMGQGDTAYVGMCGVIKQIGNYSNFNGFLIDAD